MADKDEKKVAEKKKSDVVVAGAAMFEADAGAGMQMTEDDLALPFLKIVSSELLNQDEAIADKAKLGDMINSVTKQVYSGKTPIKVIPCHYKREFLMWAPRGSGNGAPLRFSAQRISDHPPLAAQTITRSTLTACRASTSMRRTSTTC